MPSLRSYYKEKEREHELQELEAARNKSARNAAKDQLVREGISTFGKMALDHRAGNIARSEANLSKVAKADYGDVVKGQSLYKEKAPETWLDKAKMHITGISAEADQDVLSAIAKEDYAQYRASGDDAEFKSTIADHYGERFAQDMQKTPFGDTKAGQFLSSTKDKVVDFIDVSDVKAEREMDASLSSQLAMARSLNEEVLHQKRSDFARAKAPGRPTIPVDDGTDVEQYEVGDPGLQEPAPSTEFTEPGKSAGFLDYAKRGDEALASREKYKNVQLGPDPTQDILDRRVSVDEATQIISPEAGQTFQNKVIGSTASEMLNQSSQTKVEAPSYRPNLSGSKAPELPTYQESRQGMGPIETTPSEGLEIDTDPNSIPSIEDLYGEEMGKKAIEGGPMTASLSNDTFTPKGDKLGSKPGLDNTISSIKENTRKARIDKGAILKGVGVARDIKSVADAYKTGDDEVLARTAGNIIKKKALDISKKAVKEGAKKKAIEIGVKEAGTKAGKKAIKKAGQEAAVTGAKGVATGVGGTLTGVGGVYTTVEGVKGAEDAWGRGDYDEAIAHGVSAIGGAGSAVGGTMMAVGTGLSATVVGAPVGAVIAGIGAGLAGIGGLVSGVSQGYIAAENLAEAYMAKGSKAVRGFVGRTREKFDSRTRAKYGIGKLSKWSRNKSGRRRSV